MDMTNKEKHRWLMCEILQAVLISEDDMESHVTFSCPWGATYRVINTPARLNEFGKLVTRCPGFGGPKPRGIPRGPIRAVPIALEQFNKKYRDDTEVDYDLNSG